MLGKKIDELEATKMMLIDARKNIETFMHDQFTMMSAVIEGNTTIAMYNEVKEMELPKRLVNTLDRIGKPMARISDSKKLGVEIPTFADFNVKKVGKEWKFGLFADKACEELIAAYPKGVTLKNATQPQGNIRVCTLHIKRMNDYLGEIKSMSDIRLDTSIIPTTDLL